MSLSAILTEAYHFFRNHIGQLAVLTMPFLLLQIGIQMWLGMEIAAADPENPQFVTSHMVAMMVLLLVFSMLIAVLTLYLEVRSQGHQVGSLMMLKASLPFVPPLLLAGVFSGLAVAAPTMIALAAGPLWIVGLAISIYLFTRLAFVNFMVVVERLTPMEAIKGSFKFGGPIVVKTALILMLYLPISIVGGMLGQLAAPVGLPLQLIVEAVVSFFALFVNIALFRLYMVSRQQQAAAE
ncbi:hypothetical protein [Shewanella gelidii]|uniref:Membrane protein n=1 Tax=Shewanella gelidii TaxID=1642821 RepID=A0A917JSS6_9GAMM|nr:hypothetical protein [Shewanella gelidii]MCL1098517.1 hypothetical protein [Shewanella gelidii]GGI82146.1 membrane protein [Shewanella gelidii]